MTWQLDDLEQDLEPVRDKRMAHANRVRNSVFVAVGLGGAIAISALLSPFASKNPDGLDRVSQDHKFENKAAEDTPAKKLPFYGVFEEYAVRGVPEPVATPLAGVAGTLVVFGLAWGIGKLTVRRPGVPPTDDRGSY